MSALYLPLKRWPKSLWRKLNRRVYDTQKPFHAFHEVGGGRLDNQMEVVGHEAKAMHLPKRFLATLSERGQKSLAIRVVLEKTLSMVTAIHEVVNRPGILDAQLASHCAEENAGGYETMSIKKCDIMFD